MKVIIEIPNNMYDLIIKDAKNNPWRLDYFDRKIAKGEPFSNWMKLHDDLNKCYKHLFEIWYSITESTIIPEDTKIAVEMIKEKIKSDKN